MEAPDLGMIDFMIKFWFLFTYCEVNYLSKNFSSLEKLFDIFF